MPTCTSPKKTCQHSSAASRLRRRVRVGMEPIKASRAALWLVQAGDAQSQVPDVACESDLVIRVQAGPGSCHPALPMYTESSRFSICSYILTPYGCWPLLIFAVVPFGRYPSVELRRYASRHRNVSGLRRVFTDGPRQLG